MTLIVFPCSFRDPLKIFVIIVSGNNGWLIPYQPHVYAEMFNYINKLNTAISREVAVADANKALLENVLSSVTKRIKLCIEAGVAQFEMTQWFC